MSTRNGEVRLTAKSRWRDDSLVVQIIRRVLARVIAGEAHLVEKAGWKLHHEGYCGVCGRPLTHLKALNRVLGRFVVVRRLKERGLISPLFFVYLNCT